jgi:hypothetical protein
MDEPIGGEIRRRDRPKPHLARIFEAVAAVMELDRYGRQRLELIFQEGRLIQWRAHLECRTPKDLADTTMRPPGWSSVGARPSLSRRAGTPTLDPTIVVYAVPLTRHEAQMVARASGKLVNAGRARGSLDRSHRSRVGPLRL